MTDLPITEPGVYGGISMDDYHGQLTDSPSISSSGLRLIDRSPLHFWTASYLNPNRQEKKTKALSIGSAAHALVLGDELFEDRHVVSPYDEFRKAEAKAWKADAEAAGKIVIRPSEYETVQAMAAVMRSHELNAAGAFDGLVEQSLVWRDTETGVWLKARPDVLPRSGIITDYKTTENASSDALRKAAWDYGYVRQLAFIMEGLTQTGVVQPENLPELSVWLIGQEKEAPYAVNAVEIDYDWIFRSAQQNRASIDRFARCVETNDWPGYEPSPYALTPPPWAAKRLQELDEQGILPKPGGAFAAAAAYRAA